MTDAGEEDARFMRRALRLAERGWGRVAPNPLVGAVVVSGGELVGEGFHREFGAEHAEVAALRAAGRRAAGATLYVNLEPCGHYGKTPPCAEALVAAGVRRVVYACPDPHPEAGGGAARLRAAGVEVTAGVEDQAARRLNAPHLWSHRAAGEASPFVTLKLALSLDARLSRAPGVRTAVTGEEARREVQRLRAGCDAALVGRGTAEADDPLLTARGDPPPRRPPVRIVLDSRLRLRPDSRLARTAREAPLWIAAAPGADAARRKCLEAAGANVLEVPKKGEGLDLECLLRTLAAEGVGSLLVEGGGLVASSFLKGGLVHRMWLFYAPVLFGPQGAEAFPGVEPWPRGAWRTVERRAVGEDTLVVLERSSLLEELGGVRAGARPGEAG